jgi:hypothetical protein
MFSDGTTTEILARIFGLYMLAAGIGLVINRDAFVNMIAELRQQAMVPFMAGVMAFAVGAVTLSIHEDWSNGLAIVVTLIGWLSLIKGIVLLAVPKLSLSLGDAFATSPSMVVVWGSIVAVLGAVLLFVGFA